MTVQFMEYMPVALLCHFGSLTGGHYVTLVRLPNNTWVEKDDSRGNNTWVEKDDSRPPNYMLELPPGCSFVFPLLFFCFFALFVNFSFCFVYLWIVG